MSLLQGAKKNASLSLNLPLSCGLISPFSATREEGRERKVDVEREALLRSGGHEKNVGCFVYRENRIWCPQFSYWPVRLKGNVLLFVKSFERKLGNERERYLLPATFELVSFQTN